MKRAKKLSKERRGLLRAAAKLEKIEARTHALVTIGCEVTEEWSPIGSAIAQLANDIRRDAEKAGKALHRALYGQEEPAGTTDPTA